MIDRRSMLATTTMVVALLLAVPVFAAGSQRFDQKAFDAAQAAGKPILIEVTAPWCPTCKAQAPILQRLSGEPRFKQLVRFDIDFDSEKALLKKFKVQKQSTLICFKGDREVGRSTGDTNAASIEARLAKAI